ncbi:MULTISPECIES: DUF6874 family protein [unclassified Sphingomonas]|uniref:DUF6874 family protein n=1 Tax=unclassified Sphingomonas TaxID=196159 RepID=UPI0012E3EF23|nr:MULTISPECIES: hypothetical protein [unclassified Sphingomonas]
MCFDIDEADNAYVDQVIERYAAVYLKIFGSELPHDGRLSHRMDLVATHANGNPMDFAKLLAADDFTFAHDIGGIDRHIDRRTGKLLGHFLPRCSKREPASGVAA